MSAQPPQPVRSPAGVPPCLSIPWRSTASPQHLDLTGLSMEIGARASVTSGRGCFLSWTGSNFALEGSILLQPSQEILFHACSPLNSAEPHFQMRFHISTMLCPGELPPPLWSCSSPRPPVHGPALQQCQPTGTQDALPGHLCHRGEGSSSASWAATGRGSSFVSLWNQQREIGPFWGNALDFC